MTLRLIFLLYALSHCHAVISQTSEVRGRIVDAASGETLPFANVFINNTSFGTLTDENGFFALGNIPYGVQELVVYLRSHETIQAFISVNADPAELGIIEMTRLESLANLEAKGIPDSGREKQLKLFTKIFLGESEFASHCEILNPYVITFSKGPGGILLATASEPIEVSNMALGYKLSYYLTYFEANRETHSFSGQIRFAEIGTKGGGTAVRWMENRKELYLGSQRSLLKSILDSQMEEAGFNLYSVRDELQGSKVTSFASALGTTLTPFRTNNIVLSGRIPNTYKIILPGKIEVHCKGKIAKQKIYNDIPHSVGWIKVEGDTIFANRNGSVLNFHEVETSGSMQIGSLAERLPLDYSPERILKIKKESRAVEASRIEEKIYVHMDKPYYYPGEMMWYKAYINYRYPALRDSMSKTLRVELINSNRKIVKSQLLRIENGMANGNWVVTDTLSSGNYYLRAYTNLNLNFDHDNLFIKPIPILGKTEQVVDTEYDKGNTGTPQVAFKSGRKSYEVRDSISLELWVKDKKGTPAKSNLSISITDAKQVVPVKEPLTILTAFPFTTDPSNEIIKELTYPVEYGISYTGQYLNKKQKPEKATLSILQGNFDYLSVVETDDRGRFFENGLVFYDSVEFRFQIKSEKKKDDGRVVILPRDIPSLDFQSPGYSLKTVNTGKNQRLISEYEVPRGARLLNEVFIQGEKIKEEVVRPYGKPDYVIDSKQLDISSNNLLLILQGKVPGLVITNQTDETGSHTVVRIARASGLTIQAQTEPLVMIDNVPMSGRAGDILQSIDAYTIESIEVVTRVSPAYGSAGVNGVISIYTKRGIGSEKNSFDRDLQLIKLGGYSQPSQFRIPNYSSNNPEHSQIDYRSILYWNPMVATDEYGRARVSFFAADLETQYRVVVEGVNENFEPVRGVYFITVTDNNP